MKQQGDLIFEILDKKPAFWAAPISLFDAIIGGLAFLGNGSMGQKMLRNWPESVCTIIREHSHLSKKVPCYLRTFLAIWKHSIVDCEY